MISGDQFVATIATQCQFKIESDLFGPKLKPKLFKACADVEIDEYQNYEKAHGALLESLKFYERADKTDVINSRIIQVSRQLELVACFVECQRSYSVNPTKSMQVRVLCLATVIGFNKLPKLSYFSLV